MPRRMNRSLSASMTLPEFRLRSTRIARHSRLHSSMMLSVQNAFPSSVRHCTKSYDLTWFRCSGRAGRTIHRSTRAALSSVVSLVLLAPRAAIVVQRVCPSRASQPLSAAQRSGDSRIDHTDRQARSCRPPIVLHTGDRLAPYAAWIGGVSKRGKRGASETFHSPRTRSIQARRRAGLRSFPLQPPPKSACPASDHKPPCTPAHSLSAGA